MDFCADKTVHICTHVHTLTNILMLNNYIVNQLRKLVKVERLHALTSWTQNMLKLEAQRKDYRCIFTARKSTR